MPSKPVAIEATDEELIRWHQAQREGQKLKRDEQKQLSAFWAWRGAVITAESKTQSNMKTLVWAAKILQPEEDGVRMEAVTAALLEEYGINVPPWPSEHDLEMLVREKCRDLRLIPGHLRTVEMPRRTVAPAGVDFSEPTTDSEPPELQF